MKIKQLINAGLKSSLLLQIATSTKDIPWVCTVCFAFDKSFNLYWFYHQSARHSKEIVLNPQVAGAVALPYSMGDKPRGLQFSGIATELKGKEDILSGLTVLQQRFNIKPKRADQLKTELLSRSADYGLYCLCPSVIVLYDTLNFPDSPQQIYAVPTRASDRYTDSAQPVKHQ